MSRPSSSRFGNGSPDGGSGCGMLRTLRKGQPVGTGVERVTHSGPTLRTIRLVSRMFTPRQSHQSLKFPSNYFSPTQ